MSIKSSIIDCNEVEMISNKCLAMVNLSNIRNHFVTVKITSQKIKLIPAALEMHASRDWVICHMVAAPEP